MRRHLGEEPIARPEYTQTALATVRCQLNGWLASRDGGLLPKLQKGSNMKPKLAASKPLSSYPEPLHTEIAALRDSQEAMEQKMRLRDLAAKMKIPR